MSTKSKKAPKRTPMMQQYLEVKEQHPDKIVFFRMGDFYEMFFEDAQDASRLLGITLTSRDKGENPIPMAGVPHHAMEPYLKKMIEAGRKVVICDQVEDPSQAVGLVKREVTRIITPGTYFSEKSDDVRANIFLGAIWHTEEMSGIALVDLSTGEFTADRLEGAAALEELVKAGVQECLVPDQNQNSYADALRDLGNERITKVPEWGFAFKTARQLLRDHFGVQTLAGFGFDDHEEDPAICAAGAVLQYLRETQKSELPHLIKLSPIDRGGILHIDRATQNSLELIRTQRTLDKQGSLFGVLDFTRTAMGSRRMRQFILRPVTDCREIFQRQEAVREFAEHDLLRAEVQEILTSVYDLERITSRVATGRCNARDLVHLKNSLLAVGQVREALNDVFAPRLLEIRAKLALDGFVTDLIKARIIDDPPLAVSESGIIRDGVDTDLDELREISSNGKAWMAAYQERERQRTGIEKLRIGFNKVFGYYLEVTNMYKDKVPEDFIRKQTLTNSERYITPELKEYEGKVLSAEDKIKKIEYRLFQDTRDQVGSRVAEILAVAEQVADLDVFFALGKAARKYGYTAPVVEETQGITIYGGSHPVIAGMMPEGEFVPNDLFTDTDDNQFLIITGPNMAGKSTYIRQAAILVLMAQMGSFIPAASARIGVVDRIFTRIGASDEISRGQSTFMVEMTEVANILNNATQRSLIILDEVGRGTSTFDGVSIAWAIAEYIMERVGARTLFATHYHELTELDMTWPRVQNLNVAVQEKNGRVAFMHKIVEGSADKSYGIHVADIAGLPQGVIKRSEEILTNLELGSVDEYNKPRLAEKKEQVEEVMQMSIFDMHNDTVIRALREADLNSMTPLEALTMLAKLKEDLG